ncbi:hypothetical protein GC173_14225 [bacterium]|nr:hypothetical protein [bacterium]
MGDTHSLQSEPELSPAAIRYIKLGHRGHAAQDCFETGEIGLGFDGVPHELCATGRWDEVSAHFRAEGKTPGAATNHTREMRDFYEQGPNTLWITIHEGKLWWAFAEPRVAWKSALKGKLPRRRKTVGPWRSTDRHGAPLLVRNLSTRLSSVGAYRGTICAVEHAEYLIRKLNGEPEPLVSRAEQLRKELVKTAHALIATLHHHDFEVLVDIIFAASGWRRIGVLGETEADLDLLVEQTATGERAFVQVKSQASAKVFDDYVQRFRDFEGATRMFFVCHSPAANLVARAAAAPPEGVDLWLGEVLAEKAIRAGLFDWLVERTR